MYLAVFKFVEPPENNEKPIDQKSRVKFKIMSLKVKGEMDYVPELVMYYFLGNFHVVSSIIHSFNFYACLIWIVCSIVSYSFQEF